MVSRQTRKLIGNSNDRINIVCFAQLCVGMDLLCVKAFPTNLAFYNGAPGTVPLGYFYQAVGTMFPFLIVILENHLTVTCQGGA